MGGDSIGNTSDCIALFEVGCGNGKCVFYLKDLVKCLITEFDTCDCFVPNTKICVKLIDDCVVDSMFCIAKTVTCP